MKTVEVAVVLPLAQLVAEDLGAVDDDPLEQPRTMVASSTLRARLARALGLDEAMGERVSDRLGS